MTKTGHTHKMANLQQRTAPWYAARRGRLTASNMGALLGVSKWTPRQVAYERVTGKAKFVSNEAMAYGAAHEQDGVNAYQILTGNKVDQAGLWTHPDHSWIAGSPDGLIGVDGLIEVKCPFYKRVPHQEVPTDYFVQMQVCMACTIRSYCDFVSWTELSDTTIHRVKFDIELFDYLVPYWGQIYSAMEIGQEKVPELSEKTLCEIRARVLESMERNITRQHPVPLWCGSPPGHSDDDAAENRKRPRTSSEEESEHGPNKEQRLWTETDEPAAVPGGGLPAAPVHADGQAEVPGQGVQAA